MGFPVDPKKAKMTRKTFFKTILGAVGGISALAAIQEKSVCKTFKISSEKIRELSDKCINEHMRLLKAIREGAKLAQDQGKVGDHHQLAVQNLTLYKHRSELPEYDDITGCSIKAST